MIILGLVILIGGVVTVFSPKTVLNLLSDNYKTTTIYFFAIAVRLVIGLLLISQSALSKHPQAVQIIGWLLVASALILLIIGRKKFQQLLNWVLATLSAFARIGGLVAMLLGCYLIYVFA